MGDLASQLAAKFADTTDKDEPKSTTTLAQLSHIIARATGMDADDITPETNLRDEGFSSLSFIDVAVRAEEHFGVRIEGSDAADLSTAGDFARFIEEHQKAS